MQDVPYLNVNILRQLLGTQFVGVGERLVYVPEVEIDHVLAMKLAREQPEEGLVVLTDSQIAGKGRQGRRWVDTPGVISYPRLFCDLCFPSFVGNDCLPGSG